MPEQECNWRKDGAWKERYLRLYSSRRLSSSSEVQPTRISFMGNDFNAYTSLLLRARSANRDSINSSESISPGVTSILLQRSEVYGSCVGNGSVQSDNLGGHDTMLLDMVRAHSRDQDEAQDQSLNLPRDDVSDDQSSEACIHGLSLNIRATTDRSVSRSRFSRVSTRRDMDIPSILAFTATTTAPTHLEIPAFMKINKSCPEDIPRWSIRRSVCPVCSQKWKDRSAVVKIKNSGDCEVPYGLKRNFSSELPSVIAPARLRSAITMTYVPRPTLSAVDEKVAGIGIRRNPSSTWQLTRARRFRAPKPQLPPPEATAPPSATAPMARKDLGIRVNNFLTDKK